MGCFVLVEPEANGGPDLPEQLLEFEIGRSVEGGVAADDHQRINETTSDLVGELPDRFNVSRALGLGLFVYLLVIACLRARRRSSPEATSEG